MIRVKFKQLIKIIQKNNILILLAHRILKIKSIQNYLILLMILRK